VCLCGHVGLMSLSENVCLEARCSTSDVSDNQGSKECLLPVQNELLCFVRDKCSVMAVDDIVKLCTDFYKEDEILTAKSLLERSLDRRLPKRKNSDKCRSTMEDLVKACLDPSSVLSVYFATDLKRLPPVDAMHCDVSAILAELHSLRAEVRTVGRVHEELDSLRKQVSALRNTVEKSSFQSRGATNGPGNTSNDVEFPSLPSFTESGTSESQQTVVAGVPSFADHTRELRHTGLMRRVPSKQSHKPVVGTSQVNVM